MKVIHSFLLLLLFSTLLISGGCVKDTCDATHVYVLYKPVYIQPAVLRTKISLDGPQKLQQAGKIYVYGHYLFVNEYEAGIHIFDNQNPSNPRALGFLKIPGNIDMAVRNNLLYADSYVDLVTFDLSNPEDPRMVSRLENVFPHFGWDEKQGFLVDYTPTKTEEVIPCTETSEDMVFINGGIWVRRDAAVTTLMSSSPSNPVGIGGSTARFTLGKEHLYTVSEFDLKAFDLTVPETPKLANTVRIGWGIETIYPYQGYLFIGSRTGMYIYDTKDPLNPRQVSVFQHANACDPVFVDGNIAYITLRDGTTCQNFINQLEVVDITDLFNPKLLKVYPMHHPIGLSVNNGTLFICEDDAGLKVFDASEWDKIGERLLDHEKGLTTFDVITLDKPKVAIVTCKEGIYQFDYEQPNALKLLSKIAVDLN